MSKPACRCRRAQCTRICSANHLYGEYQELAAGRSGRWILCTFTTTALGASHPPCCCRPRAEKLSTWQKRSRTGWRQGSSNSGAGVRPVNARKPPSHDWLSSTALRNLLVHSPSHRLKFDGGMGIRFHTEFQGLSWPVPQANIYPAKVRTDRWLPPSAGTQSSTRGILRIVTRWGIAAGLPPDHQSVCTRRCQCRSPAETAVNSQ